jgi:hypothetical protein
VIRAVLALLVALGLAVGTGPAMAAMRDCAMASAGSGMDMDHRQDGCGSGTSDCAIACAPALLPEIEVPAPAELAHAIPPLTTPAASCDAFDPAADDPPPRSVV